MDIEPGKYASETKRWYLNCDTGTSVLVGIQEPGQWTCPIVGFEDHEATEEQIVDLETKGKMIIGDIYGLWKIERVEWNRIMNATVDYDEWGNAHGTHIVFLTTDAMHVVRLHLAFE